MRFVLWVQDGCLKTNKQTNICGHIFRKRLSISSAYIIQSFILNHYTPRPHPRIPISSLLCLLPNLLLLLAFKYMCIFYPFFHSFLCVSMAIYVHTHTKPCVTSYLLKPNSCHFLCCESQSSTACLCMFQLPLIYSWTKGRPESMFLERRQFHLHQLFLVTSCSKEGGGGVSRELALY